MEKLILAGLMTFLSVSAYAEKDRGGGDEYSIAFIQAAGEVLNWSRSTSVNLPMTSRQLAKAIEETTVESTTSLLVIDGASKDAVNYPKLKKIVFNRAAWDRLKAKSERNALVYHEYLGILGIDDSRYTYSKAILIPPGSDDSYTNCGQLLKSQQAVFERLNDFLATGTERDASIYIGSLAQYRSDVGEFGDKSDPNYGNRYSVAIYESRSSYLCTDISKLETKVKSGDLVALKLLLYYSAVSKGDDGASAEGLGELQEFARRKFPRQISQIEKKEASFFAKHPIVWVNEL